MKMQKYSRIIFLLVSSLVTVVGHAVAAPRVDLNLDEQWKFIRQDVADAGTTNFNNAVWQPVNLPHT
jgi:hypothetical protein